MWDLWTKESKKCKKNKKSHKEKEIKEVICLRQIIAGCFSPFRMSRACLPAGRPCC